MKNFKELKMDKLGKSKTSKIDPRFEFRQRKPKEIISVKDCLTHKIDDQSQTDQDLGKSIRSGLTNIPKKGDEDRVFGLDTQTISSKTMNIKQ